MDLTKAIFISDVHLDQPGDENYRRLLSYLQSLNRKTLSHLFLLGDIFDLWLGRHAYFVQKHRGLICELERLKKEGVEIHYFEGNHDLYLRDFWERELGFHVHDRPLQTQLGPWRVRLEHGDQMDPEDRGYIFLRWFLRTSLLRFLVRYLPGKWVAMLGEWASRNSRHYTSKIKTVSSERTIRMIESHAEKSFALQKFDWLIAGHVHVDHLGEKGAYKVVNLGSWMTKPRVFELNPTLGAFRDL